MKDGTLNLPWRRYARLNNYPTVCLVYLDDAIERYRASGRLNTTEDLHAALIEGVVLRVRPKAMTVAVIIAGLIPILIGSGTGSEAMSRIAAPMVGGMLTAPLLSLFVLPAAYILLRGNRNASK